MNPVTVDPRRVACPLCGALAGGWCKRPSGHAGPFVAFHAARRAAAAEAARAEIAAAGSAAPDDDGLTCLACGVALDEIDTGPLVCPACGAMWSSRDEYDATAAALRAAAGGGAS